MKLTELFESEEDMDIDIAFLQEITGIFQDAVMKYDFAVDDVLPIELDGMQTWDKNRHGDMKVDIEFTNELDIKSLYDGDDLEVKAAIEAKFMKSKRGKRMVEVQPRIVDALTDFFNDLFKSKLGITEIQIDQPGKKKKKLTAGSVKKEDLPTNTCTLTFIRKMK